MKTEDENVSNDLVPFIDVAISILAVVSDRYYFITINKHKSTTAPVIHGVIHKVILGPLPLSKNLIPFNRYEVQTDIYLSFTPTTVLSLTSLYKMY